ncbi:type 4 fimbrial pilin-like protein [Ramlibacter tataouinensis TTB310]|uniref:Type II secretion system protein H n=1 Tax=Ramlibacter tataouinensis (strain ATCC BAA-407 / DSM 14655 / LMG 21543 / TTB310) TaxID=365046 RepID=F5Y4W5_RAMTT|nr:type 4 fimbrial pilin-like protein [Ramlibacter tataouinensis TTB310]
MEMLTTLTVAAVTVAVAIPSFRSVADARKLDGAAMAMFSTLSLARSEAIKRNAPVVLCKSADGMVCAGSGGWEQGWITFHDGNNNALVDHGETVIQKAHAVGSGIRFSGNLQVARYISFSALGAPRTVSGAFQAGTLTACQRRDGAANAKQVILSATGRARLSKAGISECQ